MRIAIEIRLVLRPLLIMGALLLAPAILMAEYENEIIVRTANNIKSPEDADALIRRCKKHDVSVIAIAFKQDEDDEVPSGELFYPSKIAPVADGYEDQDLLRHLIEKAHEQSIKIKAWIPQFHDQVAYLKEPDWGMVALDGNRSVVLHEKGSEYFVNPLHEDVQAYERSIIKEIVSEYDIDGIVLDWVRFDGYDMDLSRYTRSEYAARYGYDPITIDFSSENTQRAEWNDYRRRAIADYVRSVRELIEEIRPDVELGVYVLSPGWSEVAQDPALFHQEIDFIAPMCYFDDWGYPVDWVYGPRADSILVMTKEKVLDTAIVPVFDTDWDDAIYEKILTNIKSRYPDIQTISWFEYGRWSDKSLKRVSALREVK